METATMGKVLVAATIENLEDLFRVRRGDQTEAEVRRIEVPDALIDTGAFGLLMPMRMVDQLGLTPVRTRMSRTVGGDIPITTYEAARLTIQGRTCVMEVSGIDDNLPVIIGQLPLEAMDWVVDMKGHRLIGNPEHGGEEMVDIL
jgi:predicted aspartyl protease